MLDTLRADLERYTRLAPPTMSRLRRARMLLETQGVWATAVYRFGSWSNRDAPRPLRPLCKAAYLVGFKMVEALTGISLPAQARIGRGLYIVSFRRACA